MKKMSIP